MSLVELIQEYRFHLARAEEFGKKVAEAIANALKPIIPDIKYSLGWEEGGIDTICFYSKQRQRMNILTRVEMIRAGSIVPLDEVITKVFPELEMHIDTPFGIWLTKEEAEKAKELLRKLRVARGDEDGD